MSNTQSVQSPAEAPVEAVSARPYAGRVPIDVANRVSETVAHCENAVDQAFMATAEYAQIMPSMRGQTQIPFGAAQDAVDHATEALKHIAAARGHIKESHAVLNKLAKKEGLDAVMDGGFLFKFWGP